MKVFNHQGFASRRVSVTVQNLELDTGGKRNVVIREDGVRAGVVHFSGVNPYVYMSSPGDMKSNIVCRALL